MALMEELLKSKGMGEPTIGQPTNAFNAQPPNPQTANPPAGQPGGVQPSGPPQQGNRPIDIVAAHRNMTPFQVWQEAQSQGGDPQQVVQQMASEIQSRGLSPTGGTNEFSGGPPAPQTANPPAGQPGGAPAGGPSSPGTPSGIAAWEEWHNKPYPGPGGSDPSAFGGGVPSGSQGGGGFAGQPDILGTDDDPLFGSGGGGAPELPGGEEGGYQFRTTPGYNFRLQQAQQAVENSAASRGGLLSGNTLKDLTRFSQGLAEEEFQNVFNMLGNLRNPGATQTMSRAAQNLGANVGNTLQAGGQAQAGGILGGNQAMQSGIGGAAGILGNYFANQSGGSLPAGETPQLFPGGASAGAGGFFGGGLGG